LEEIKKPSESRTTAPFFRENKTTTTSVTKVEKTSNNKTPLPKLSLANSV
jgi:hypothetical protein